VWARFSAHVQTCPGAHPASCKMGTGSFLGVSGGGVTLTPQPLLVPWSRKSRAIPLLPLWAVRPVQSLSACTRVTFTFFVIAILRFVCKLYECKFHFEIPRSNQKLPHLGHICPSFDNSLGFMVTQHRRLIGQTVSRPLHIRSFLSRYKPLLMFKEPSCGLLEI